MAIGFDLPPFWLNHIVGMFLLLVILTRRDLGGGLGSKFEADSSESGVTWVVAFLFDNALVI